jgi:hypothetical protein
MIVGVAEISRITGCMLSNTDLIPVVEEKILPGTEDIEHLLSGRFNCYFYNKLNEIVLISTKIPDTAGSVCSIHNRPGKPGWTLIFTMKSEGPIRFVSCTGY